MTTALHVVPQRPALHLTPVAFLRLVRWGEAGFVLACLLAGFWHAGGLTLPLWQGIGWVVAGGVLVAAYRGLTAPGRTELLAQFDQPGAALRLAARVWLGLLVLVLGTGYLWLGSALALAMASALLPAALLSLLWRQGVEALVPYLVARNHLGLHVALIGGGAAACTILAPLIAMRQQGVRVLGLFDDREAARSPAVQMGVPKLGRVADLPEILHHTRLDLVIVIMPPSAEARITQLLDSLWHLPVDIRLAPVSTTLLFRPRTYRWLGAVPLLALFDRPLRPVDAALKRGFDLCAGLLILTALAPLLALLALAIRIDSPGPVMFRQWREGYAGRPFLVWKFRTLHHAQADATALRPVTQGDSRVTRLGRMLRRSSLDELPQLFNVIDGSMSLVGPRPHAVGARSSEIDFARVVRSYGARHRVRPGMTGWAQVRGLRGPIQTPEQISGRVALDLDYIDRWSLLFDLRILALTLPTVLRGENAV